jgi:hypothetical protein
MKRSGQTDGGATVDPAWLAALLRPAADDRSPEEAGRDLAREINEAVIQARKEADIKLTEPA